MLGRLEGCRSWHTTKAFGIVGLDVCVADELTPFQAGKDRSQKLARRALPLAWERAMSLSLPLATPTTN